jgi:hypothetical protein
MKRSLNPGTERPGYCDDWACPAHVSCARHFGRSAEYAAMKMPAPSTGHGPGTIYWRGVRDHCAKYEFDQPKRWLMPQEQRRDLNDKPSTGG